jgi:hypothetical protein
VSRSIVHRLLVIAVLAAVVPTPSQARYACAVRKTADGFVSLRQGPSARHAEVAKMKAQELVGLLHPDRDDIVRSGDWLFVQWYPGTQRTADHMPDVAAATARTGWVRDRLIDCFEE